MVEVEDFEEANAYLELGWVLLGVHQYTRMQVGMIRAGTTYVLGHTDPDPPRPGVKTGVDFEIEE
ncbi:MAG: hypothetical protein JXB47_10355 [Anaerolineae bacterium]|nr:hypothetical protein [Anaerolineae bacterium]